MRLATIIVTYNSGDVLEDCVNALDHAVGQCHSLIEAPAEVIVVDNNSVTRPTATPVQHVSLRTVELNQNIGFSPAVNVALEELGAVDLVLLLNPDARLDPEALRHLADVWRTDPPAVAGPVLVGRGGTPRGYSERPFHSLSRELIRQVAPFLLDRRPWGRMAGRTGQGRCLTGACLLVDGAFLRAVGGLDTYVPMYLEDVELCWRAKERHRQVRLVRAARCEHDLGGSSDGENFDASHGLHLHLLAARVEFIRRRRGAVIAAATRAVIALGACARIAVASATGRHRLAAKHHAALTWAIRDGGPPAWPPS